VLPSGREPARIYADAAIHTALRDKIGNDLLWLPGVTAVVIDSSDRVLLVKRADSGKWTLVTGCLEPGEEPARGAAREVVEETGVTAVAERLLAVEALPAATCPNGDKVQFLDTAFHCRYVAGEPAAGDDESTDADWFSPDALPLMSERMIRCIGYALDPGPFTRFRT
jgi:ADP-ribose pyrophosphatase YjhB (NUDIX family)